MTKEIIIDDCNVAECIFYGDDKCDLGYIADSFIKKCKCNSNCYFKQLQRLKKEKEELKKYIGGFVANCRYCDEWYMDKCNYIKKENKYKQALEEIRDIAKEYISCESDKLPCPQSQEILEKIKEVLNKQK